MDHVLGGYPCVPFGDFNFCYRHNIMYQRDMTPTVAYDENYFRHYVDLEGTPTANALNAGRVALSHKYADCILDVGVGSGEFIKRSHAKMYGTDVNPVAEAWLRAEGLWADDIPADVTGVSLWDVLEHMPRPSEFLSRIRPRVYLFLALPLFDNLLRVRESKHFKPGEHILYLSFAGLLTYMTDCNFDLVEVSDHEISAGRQDVWAFVFRKAP